MSDSEIDYHTCDFCRYAFNGICTNTKSLHSGDDTDKVRVCGHWILDEEEVKHYELVKRGK